ncbi:MAG: lamin tail domain-containing protein, partial [bacterium]
MNAPLPLAPSTTVVISQAYGGGGNTGSTFRNDFIELFNRGTTPQLLTGWAVQYASATGTTWQVTNLTNVTLQPGQYYLVQEAQGAGGTTSLPTPDAIGTIALAAAAGKVALTNT